MENNSISCNICNNKVEGIAYITRCGHIHCPACAKSHFKDSSLCPECGTRLSAQDLMEVNIGIPNNKLTETLLQSVLHSTEWTQILTNMACLMDSINEVNRFISAQVLQKIKFKNKSDEAILSELKNLTDRLRDTEDRLQDQQETALGKIQCMRDEVVQKDLQLLEMQEAYQEKVRKCHAWQKAYNNVRQQLTGKLGATMSDSSQLHGSLLPQSETMHFPDYTKETKNVYMPVTQNISNRTEISAFRIKPRQHRELFNSNATSLQYKQPNILSNGNMENRKLIETFAWEQNEGRGKAYYDFSRMAQNNLNIQHLNNYDQNQHFNTQSCLFSNPSRIAQMPGERFHSSTQLQRKSTDAPVQLADSSQNQKNSFFD